MRGAGVAGMGILLLRPKCVGLDIMMVQPYIADDNARMILISACPGGHSLSTRTDRSRRWRGRSVRQHPLALIEAGLNSSAE